MRTAQERKTEGSATIYDVARRVGVSTATASRVLNNAGYASAAARESVLKAADELGFQVNVHAQRLSVGRSRNQVSLFWESPDLGVGTRMMNSLYWRLRSRGYDVPIHIFGGYRESDSPQRLSLLREVCRARPAGLVYNGEADDGPLSEEGVSLLRRYQAEGGEIICYGDNLPLECRQVVMDDEDNTYQAARHLLTKGHRRIGFAVGSPRNEWNSPRMNGLRRALGERGLTPREEWVYFAPEIYDKGGAMTAEWFLSLPEGDRPTGLCVVNDTFSSALVNRLFQRGLRVPQDVSIVSHDDAPAAEYAFVPLTSVSRPVETIALHLAELMHEALQSEALRASPPRQIVVRGTLTERESVAPVTD